MTQGAQTGAMRPLKGAGGRFKTEGTCIDLWPIHVDIWQKPTQYYKAVIFQLKINKIFLASYGINESRSASHILYRNKLQLA